MENEVLIRNAQNGDRSALTKLLMENRNLVAAVVSRFVFDRDCHKDVIQNVFMKVVDSITSFRNQCRFATWLYRISVNECCEYNRKKLKSSIFN
jgi:RNA polymerase sigma factor (sigma-70 family)